MGLFPVAEVVEVVETKVQTVRTQQTKANAHHICINKLAIILRRAVINVNHSLLIA